MSDDIQVEVSSDEIAKLQKLTKEKLINELVNMSLKAQTYKLRCQTAIEAEREAQIAVNTLTKSVDKLQTKLGLAESYVEQGRSMIEAIMERWHEYDV